RYAFDPLPMRHAEHRCLADVWQHRQHALNLSWIHIHAAADDQIGDPARDVQIRMVVKAPDVARSEDAVGKRTLGLLWIAPVSVKCWIDDGDDLALLADIGG